jgi:hypothetical protein
VLRQNGDSSLKAVKESAGSWKLGLQALGKALTVLVVSLPVYMIVSTPSEGFNKSIYEEFGLSILLVSH